MWGRDIKGGERGGGNSMRMIRGDFVSEGWFFDVAEIVLVFLEIWKCMPASLN